MGDISQSLKSISPSELRCESPPSSTFLDLLECCSLQADQENNTTDMTPLLIPFMRPYEALSQERHELQLPDQTEGLPFVFNPTAPTFLPSQIKKVKKEKITLHEFKIIHKEEPKEEKGEEEKGEEAEEIKEEETKEAKQKEKEKEAKKQKANKTEDTDEEENNFYDRFPVDWNCEAYVLGPSRATRLYGLKDVVFFNLVGEFQWMWDKQSTKCRWLWRDILENQFTKKCKFAVDGETKKLIFKTAKRAVFIQPFVEEEILTTNSDGKKKKVKQIRDTLSIWMYDYELNPNWGPKDRQHIYTQINLPRDFQTIPFEAPTANGETLFQLLNVYLPILLDYPSIGAPLGIRDYKLVERQETKKTPDEWVGLIREKLWSDHGETDKKLIYNIEGQDLKLQIHPYLLSYASITFEVTNQKPFDVPFPKPWHLHDPSNFIFLVADSVARNLFFSF